MSTATRWPAPAKLNLFLHITGRRADGYHELQTVFQLLDFCDEIAIEPTDDGAITRLEGPGGVAPDADLAVRAARALQAAGGTGRGAQLAVRKRIPQGGGLGGGSSDAATVLVALNEVWGLGFNLSRLAAIGAELGADVPVFVMGASAWAEGIGERLTPVLLPEDWFVVIHPGVAVATGEVFQAPELTRNSPLITIRGLFQAGTRNDCEPVVRARFPAVAAALDWLGQFAEARLTGTGSCVFAKFGSAAHAERVAARVPDEWRGWVAHGLNRSPLHARLAVWRGEGT
ncbi:MAG: 4-diphosphocytidyl-2-C-methyl-D-erythritol kinase [Steroidobacteraceae bacterium]|nr:4-diphosphocytidyl-2-C-methyl-D-erythritol kinase [Steroidobacteraceae bacterium]